MSYIERLKIKKGISYDIEDNYLEHKYQHKTQTYIQSKSKLKSKSKNKSINSYDIDSIYSEIDKMTIYNKKPKQYSRKISNKSLQLKNSINMSMIELKSSQMIKEKEVPNENYKSLSSIEKLYRRFQIEYLKYNINISIQTSTQSSSTNQYQYQYQDKSFSNKSLQKLLPENNHFEFFIHNLSNSSLSLEDLNTNKQHFLYTLMRNIKRTQVDFTKNSLQEMLLLEENVTMNKTSKYKSDMESINLISDLNGNNHSFGVESINENNKKGKENEHDFNNEKEYMLNSNCYTPYIKHNIYEDDINKETNVNQVNSFFTWSSLCEPVNLMLTQQELRLNKLPVITYIQPSQSMYKYGHEKYEVIVKDMTNSIVYILESECILDVKILINDFYTIIYKDIKNDRVLNFNFFTNNLNISFKFNSLYKKFLKYVNEIVNKEDKR